MSTVDFKRTSTEVDCQTKRSAIDHSAKRAFWRASNCLWQCVLFIGSVTSCSQAVSRARWLLALQQKQFRTTRTAALIVVYQTKKNFTCNVAGKNRANAKFCEKKFSPNAINPNCVETRQDRNIAFIAPATGWSIDVARQFGCFSRWRKCSAQMGKCWH